MNEFSQRPAEYGQIEIRAVAAPWWRGVELLVRSADDGSRGMLTFQPVAVGGQYPPTGVLSMQAAQTLMDDMWNSGIRPTEGAGSAGALRATQQHLDDMRKIAFAQFNLEERHR